MYIANQCTDGTKETTCPIGAHFKLWLQFALFVFFQFLVFPLTGISISYFLVSRGHMDRVGSVYEKLALWLPFTVTFRIPEEL